MKILTHAFSYLPLLALMAGCNSVRYQYNDDHQPDEIPPLSHVEDVIPRYEPYSRGGNKDYQVYGIDYKVLTAITAFSEQGYASWYGNKFHGHLTSNGERYDMFAMSAAHKHLPLPSYVKVTNTENNKTVIVRVNDRGPFHEGRVIDLSYAAAEKLDMIKSGTAKVKLELIHIAKPQNHHDDIHLNESFYVQYLVTTQADKAEKLGLALSEKYQIGHIAVKEKATYRLRLGPLKSADEAQTLLLTIQKEFAGAFIVHQQKR